MLCFLHIPSRIVNKAETSDTYYQFAENAENEDEAMKSTLEEVDLRLVYSVNQRVIVVVTELSTVSAFFFLYT